MADDERRSPPHPLLLNFARSLGRAAARHDLAVEQGLIKETPEIEPAPAKKRKGRAEPEYIVTWRNLD